MEGSTLSAGYLGAFESVEALDDYTLQMNLNMPDALLISGSRGLGHIAIIPHEAVEYYGEDFGLNPVGSGAFEFVEYSPDEHVILQRNEDYWLEPYLDQVIFKVIPDDFAMRPRDLGWYIYGTGPGYQHKCNGNNLAQGPSPGFDPDTGEYCPDHGKDFPVTLPGAQDLTLGGWWSGSPFLGDTGDLPPGEGGLNPFGGYFFVWHSHAEKELTTFDIFPGGSLGAVVVRHEKV